MVLCIVFCEPKTSYEMRISVFIADGCSSNLVLNDDSWSLIRLTDGRVHKKVKARDLWDRISYAAWSGADPCMQYDTTINEWHTCPASGRINGDRKSGE